MGEGVGRVERAPTEPSYLGAVPVVHLLHVLLGYFLVVASDVPDDVGQVGVLGLDLHRHLGLLDLLTQRIHFLRDRRVEVQLGRAGAVLQEFGASQPGALWSAEPALSSAAPSPAAGVLGSVCCCQGSSSDPPGLDPAPCLPWILPPACRQRTAQLCSKLGEEFCDVLTSS